MCEYENCKNAKKPNEDFCGRHIKKGNKLRFPEKYCKKNNCVRLKFTDDGWCEVCFKRIENKKKERNKNKVQCEYMVLDDKRCCNMSQANKKYCKLHEKLGLKKEFPEQYCTKQGCSGKRKEGYKRCEVCVKRSKKYDEMNKKKRKNTKAGKCKKCGIEIEEYKTNSGKEPTLCKTHYLINLNADKNRKPRTRDYSKELKTYKEKYPEKYKEQLRKKRIYNKTLNSKLSHYKNKAKNIEKRKLFISDEEMIELFKSNCKYCNKEAKEGNYSGIDRVDNNKPYTRENVVACCGMCNMMKCAYEKKEFIEQCKRIAKLNC